MNPEDPAPVAFYDMPTTRVKDLLVWHFVMTSTPPRGGAGARGGARGRRDTGVRHGHDVR